VSAVTKFHDMWKNRSVFDWGNSPEWKLDDGELRPVLGDDVRISLVYLGSTPTHALLGCVASALNQLNDMAHQTNFHDALTQLYLLRWVYTYIMYES